MRHVKIGNITQKSIKPSKKAGYLNIKFRTYFINPLTNKRREILSNWFIVPEKTDSTDKVKVSPQIQSIVRKELQKKANQLFEELTKSKISIETDIT